ncbi:TPA: excisionase [Streptococcus pneumoniae]|nr:excisionase [Streptococcus pneumoniae]
MPVINNVNYRPVSQSEKAEYGGYKSLEEKFNDLSETTLKLWANEMKNHPEFKYFVYHPTHKTVLVNYKAFALYCMWKSRNRYKTKKESLRDMLEDLKKVKDLLQEVAELDLEDLIA